MRDDVEFGGRIRNAIRRREARFVQLNGTRGARNIFKIDDQRIEQRRFADTSGKLIRFGGVNLIEKLIEQGEVFFRKAVRKIGGVFRSEGLNTGGTVDTALIAVVHR